MKTVLVMLAVVMVTQLSGCGGGSDEDRRSEPRREAADPETETLTESVKRPLDKAEAVQEQLEQSRQERDKAIDEATDP